MKSLFFLSSQSYGLITIPRLNEILANLEALQALDLAIVNCSYSQKFLEKKRNLRYLRLGISYESIPEFITNIQFMISLDLQEFPYLRHFWFGDMFFDRLPTFGNFAELQNVLAYFNHPTGKVKLDYQKGRKELADLTLKLLQPPSTMKSLAIQGWNAMEIPQWVIDKSSVVLSNLVSLHLADCNRCQHLPSFNALLNLESLQLWGLTALEWVENWSSSTAYLPSLKLLILVNLPQLKGWSKVNEPDANCKLEERCFHHLLELRISGCPELLSLPITPSLQSLELSNNHGDLLQQLLSSVQSLRVLKLADMSIPEPLPRGFDCLTTLEELSLCWLYNLRILPESIEHFTQLRKLVIRYLPKLEVLPELLGLSALEHLEIIYCPRLKQIPKYFPKRESLKCLEIKQMCKAWKEMVEKGCQ